MNNVFPEWVSVRLDDFHTDHRQVRRKAGKVDIVA